MGKLWLCIGLFFVSSFVSGDNLLLVPQLLGEKGSSVMDSLLIAYGVVGVSVYAICTYVGARKGLALGQAIQLYLGPWAEKVYSVIALVVALAASGLIGGYYGGQIISEAFPVTPYLGTFISISFFLLLAAKRPPQVVYLINWMVPLLLLILVMACLYDNSTTSVYLEVTAESDTPIAFETLLLVGFNAGGVVPQLVTEMARSLQKKPWIAIFGSIVAKFLELIFTIFFGLFLVNLGKDNTLPILHILDGLVPLGGQWIMAVLTLGTLGLFLGPTLTLCRQSMNKSSAFDSYTVYLLFFSGFFGISIILPEVFWGLIMIGAICQSLFFLSLVLLILAKERPYLEGIKSQN